MQYETERVLCAVDKDVARVAFKSADVVEYTEAAKLGAELRHFVQGFQFRVAFFRVASSGLIGLDHAPTSAMMKPAASAALA